MVILTQSGVRLKLSVKVLLLTAPNMTNPEDGEGLEGRTDSCVDGQRQHRLVLHRQVVCLNPANETNPAVLKVDEIF